MKNGFKSFIAKRYFLLIILATLISAILLAVMYKPALSILPIEKEKREKLYEVSTFSDVADSGASEVSVPTISSSGIAYSCTIRNGYEYPYAGLSLYANPYISTKQTEITSFMKFAGYTHLKIRARTSGSNSLIFSIQTSVKNLTKQDGRPRKPNEITLTGQNGVINKEFLLSDLQTPAWWYSSNNTTKEIVGESDFSNVIEMVFQNGGDAPIDLSMDVTIDEITLTKDMKDEVATVVACLLLFISLISLVRFAKNAESTDKGDKIIISYDRVEIEDENDTDVQRIVEYIASNYPNPDFSVEQLAKGAGVSTSRIPTLLKKQYAMNFKQYLNTIRITEAKRLLLETEHQIVTIAHSVGYNNIPHFNRTFKQVTGLSPKQYRDTPELAIDNLPGSSLK